MSASAATARAELRVGFVLAPNFTMLALSAFVDTLRLAADEDDWSRPIHCDWRVLSDDTRPVRASCGLDVTPTARFGDPRDFDYIVVVGGLLDGSRISRAAGEFLRRAAAAGVPLAGVCTGSFALAGLGLLDDRRVCVSWFHHDDFASRFPQLAASSTEQFIEDRDRLTCAGGTSVMHLAAHLVARHRGRAAAAKALRIMLEDLPRAGDAPQPAPVDDLSSDDARVRRAMLLIERHADGHFPLDELAREVGVSPRHLGRLFQHQIGMTPTAYAMRLRLRRARELLEKTRQPIVDIAMQCGFVSNSHFSRAASATCTAIRRARRVRGDPRLVQGFARRGTDAARKRKRRLAGRRFIAGPPSRGPCGQGQRPIAFFTPAAASGLPSNVVTPSSHLSSSAGLALM
ncbi:GlxA family transcriptional regulator [Derxia lacustris]|uniref:GlxA family transcriptional regulator n=1 Tax=Derxia lacustris TaxID=764842 RepID=UPI000A176C13|nr:helix-turn-helix domain-containing protein [Derxia lacustris]